MKNQEKEAFAELYDCFLRKFAEAEETEGGEFYTPKSISELLVEMTETYRGVVYDPCCGTGGILVQCRKFLEKNKKDLGRHFSSWSRRKKRKIGGSQK